MSLQGMPILQHPKIAKHIGRPTIGRPGMQWFVCQLVDWLIDWLMKNPLQGQPPLQGVAAHAGVAALAGSEHRRECTGRPTTGRAGMR